LTRNFGKEAAISAGLAASHGRACLVIDADLQHPPDLIPQMVRLWREEGWEVVEGIKSSRGRERQVNRWGAWVFYTLLSRLSGYHFLGASDFKLLDRKVVAAWQQMQERNTFFRGMIRWMGFRRIEVPFDVPERLDSMSRWSFFGLVRLAMIALTAFSSLPLQVVTILGSFFLGCSFFFALYALALYFAGKALPGFTTIILLELIIGGVLMVSLGIIGTYVARIYDEAKHRPRYLVASRLESLSLQRHQGAK
jgi:dolichol-phosphate mannosyltransferase